MVDPAILNYLNDPVVEAIARCSRPQRGYRFVEPVAVVRNPGLLVVVRLYRNRPRWRVTTNQFAVLDAQGQWIWSRFVGLADVAYHLRRDGWSNALITAADEETERTAARLKSLVRQDVTTLEGSKIAI